MADQHPTLAAFYEGWENYQKQLVKAVASLSDAQLALTAGPELRSVSGLVLHILATRISWFHGVAGAGSAELKPMEDWDLPGAPSFTVSELVAALETSWKLVTEALAQWTLHEIQEPFTFKGRTQDHTFTRQWIIWHVIEHDLHHGGELSFLLGMHGLPGVDIE